VEACRRAGVNVKSGGAYLNMEGPQFSTKAESNLYRSWGMDVIGMTNLTEARLAREAELCYVTVAMVTDYDCWHAEHEHVTVDQIIAVLLKNAEHAWHGVTLNQPDWSDGSHGIVLTAKLRDEKLVFHLILNAFWQPLDFELPPIDAGSQTSWRRWIDTSLESPNDIVPWESAPSVSGSTYRASPRSVALLFSTPITSP